MPLPSLLAPAAVLAAVTAVFGATTTSTGVADDPMRASDRAAGMLGVADVRGLHLSADQRAVVRQIIERHEATIAAAVQSAHDAKAELTDLTLRNPVDAGAVRIAADEYGRKLGDASVAAATLRGEVRDILTPDQATRFDELRTQRATTRSGLSNGAARGAFAERRRAIMQRIHNGELDLEEMRAKWTRRMGSDAGFEEALRDAAPVRARHPARAPHPDRDGSGLR